MTIYVVQGGRPVLVADSALGLPDCARCGRPVDRVDPRYTDEGDLVLLLRCHGAVEMHTLPARDVGPGANRVITLGPAFQAAH